MSRAWVYGDGTGVRLKDGKALSGFYAGYYDDNDPNADGKPKRKAMRFDTLNKAKDFVEAHNGRGAHERLGFALGAERKQVNRVRLADGVTEFMQSQEGLQPATVSMYRVGLAALQAACNRNCWVDTVSATDLERLWACRRATVSESSVKKDMIAVRRFFRWAVETKGCMKESPLRKSIRRPTSAPIARQRPNISTKDIDALLKHCETDDQRWVIRLAVTTGQDRGFICRLAPMHVDWDHKALRWQRRKTKKGFMIELHDEVFAELRRRQPGMQPDQRFFRGVLKHGLPKVTWDKLTPEQRSERDWFVKCRRAAGLDHILFRDLRAYATRRAMDAGLTLKQASQMLGHASLTTTASHYDIPDPDAARKLQALPLPGSRPSSKSKAKTRGRAPRRVSAA